MKNLHAGIHRGCTSLHSSNCTQESSLSMSLPILVLSGLLIVSFLVSVRYCLFVVLIWISLTVNDAEHLQMCLLAAGNILFFH